MTYPPPSGPPDPYQPPQHQDPQPPYGQPQQPYGRNEEPTTPYSQQYPQYPSSGQPYAQGPYGQPAYPAQPRTNSMAIASLVCSLVGLATCISAPVGIVLGHIARRQIRQTGEGGSGMATAGLWIGYILTVGFIIFWVAIIILAVNSNSTTTT